MIADRVMMSYRFHKMAPIGSQIYSQFLVWPRLTFKKVKSYRLTKFRPDMSIHSRYITTSGFGHQTAAILKFYFWLRIRLFHCHRYVILHWPAKFYANRMIADGVMTSYWFYKMAAIASQIYFQFLFWPRLTFKKFKSYRLTNFRPDMSIHGRYITTSGFSNQTAAILKFYLRLQFLTFHCHRHVIMHWPTTVYANRMIADGVMTSCFYTSGSHRVANLQGGPKKRTVFDSL